MRRSEESIPDRIKKGTIPVYERLSSMDKDQLHAVGDDDLESLEEA